MPSVASIKQTTLITLLFGTVLVGTAGGSRAQAPGQPGKPPASFRARLAEDARGPSQVEGELVARLASGADAAALATRHGLGVKRRLRFAPNTYVFEGVQVPIDHAVAAMRQSPGVVRAGRHYLYRPAALPPSDPNDPILAQQRALRQVGASNLWGITVGQRLVNGPARSALVGIIDGGFETTHPDLFENFSPNGFDFILDQPYDESAFGVNLFFDNHGTQVASCIAPINHNLEGLAGLPWEGVTMLPLRCSQIVAGPNNTFFSRLSSAAVVDAIYYCIQQEVDVINMSFGLAGGFDPLVEQAIMDAYDQGIVVVAATGDGGLFGFSAPVDFPATIPQVVAVGAVGFSGEHAFYSNSGPELDLVAPGGNDSNGFDTTRQVIVANSFSFFGGFLGLPPGYGINQGTSLAAGYVSSALATLITQGARNESLTPQEQVDQLTALLLNTARNPFGTIRSDDFGAGILNAEGALKASTQFVDLVAPTANETTASFAEPLQARIGLPSGVPLGFTDFQVFQNGTDVSDRVEILDPNVGAIEYEPDAETRYGIGVNRLNVITENPFDAALQRSLEGPAAGRIPERAFRFRVAPRIEYPGLRMFSMPYELQPDADTLNFLFGGNRAKLGRWVPSREQYAIFDSVGSPADPEAELTTDDAGVDAAPVGVGFWLRLVPPGPPPPPAEPGEVNARQVQPTQLQVLGRSRRTGFYRIPLEPGFNMIGNPYPFRVPWNVVNVQFGNEVMSISEAARRNLMRNTIWRFQDGRYTFQALPNGEMVEFEGHWVRSFRSLTLIVPRVGTVLGQNSAAAPPASGSGWTSAIRAVVDGRTAGEVFLGAESGARHGYGPEDVETPPPPGGGTDLRIRQAAWGAHSGAYLRDLRARRGGPQQWNLEVETSRPGTSVKLAWDRFPAATGALLQVQGRAGRHRLTRGGSVTLDLPKAGVHRVTVTALPGAGS